MAVRQVFAESFREHFANTPRRSRQVSPTPYPYPYPYPKRAASSLVVMAWLEAGKGGSQ